LELEQYQDVPEFSSGSTFWNTKARKTVSRSGTSTRHSVISEPVPKPQANLGGTTLTANFQENLTAKAKKANKDGLCG
jgi:hypothetical protein